MNPDVRSRVRGSLLGGAVGDALGAPVEFHSLSNIRDALGAAGVTGYLPAYGMPGGAITDDTQLSLFTADGLIRALVRDTHYGMVDAPGVMLRSYQRWLTTQGDPLPPDAHPATADTGWLIGERRLHARRAPGMTCLSALRSGGRGSVAEPINDSKGCGAIMRSAPIGLIGDQGVTAFEFGVRCGALTHGHPDGYLSAGFLAGLIARIVGGLSLDQSLDAATSQLVEYPGHEGTLAAVTAARRMATLPGPPSSERVERLGAGWVGEETLAIAIYCVLATKTVRDALLLAVNHSGDTDSTASVAGNVVGALVGEAALPAEWVGNVELADVITRIADDLVAAFYEDAVGSEHEPMTPEVEAFIARYPGY